MKHRHLFILILLLLCALPGLAKAEEDKAEPAQTSIVFPVDEATQKPEFFTFRRDLIKALIARDHKAVQDIMSPDLKYSFGEQTGQQGFDDEWQLTAPESRFYPMLLEILLNGGAFTGETFCAPYTFTSDKVSDPFTEVILIAKDVPMYDAPSLEASVLTRLSFEILTMQENASPQGWQAVKTSEGLAGYIQTHFLRSPIDYRACFSPENGAYKMNLFIAGD